MLLKTMEVQFHVMISFLLFNFSTRKDFWLSNYSMVIIFQINYSAYLKDSCNIETGVVGRCRVNIVLNLLWNKKQIKVYE